MKIKDLLWISIILIFGLSIIIPQSREVFVLLTENHPYIMGFTKTAILATMGELLVLRIITGEYFGHTGIFLKFIVWGFLGMAFVLVFPIFGGGVTYAQSKYLLPSINNELMIGKIFNAFLISTFMNLIFAPTFMLLHRVTDTFIELGNGNIMHLLKVKIDDVISAINFKRFIKFTIIKTIPLFWIPAHTITFLLEDTYRVLMAAFLSIILGVILTFSKRKQA